MAKKSVRWLETEVHPMFHIPDGADELVYGDDDFDIPDDSVAGTPITDDDGSDDSNTPKILGIVSQTLRRHPDGTTVVDVVLNVSDIVGYDKYEVRITKSE